MSKLTKRQEGFAQAIAGGKTQSDAYRENYSTKNMADKTVWVEASILANAPKVSIRIEEIKKEIANEQLWTRVQSIKVLVKIAEEGMTDSPRIAAIKELNSMHGFNEPVKVELSKKEEIPTLTELYVQMRQAAVIRLASK